MKTIYKCNNCGKVSKRWAGKCPDCGKFSTFEEETIVEENLNTSKAGLKSSGAIKPSEKAFTIKEINKNPVKKITTGISEVDRVLGGGLVEAEVVLFAGQPGAGKSTLSLSIANNLANENNVVLYSSGEESVNQIGMRANRMGISNVNIKIVNETNLETLLGYIEAEKPNFLIVDSLQTIASNEVQGSVGSVQQSKEAAHTLTRIAKKNNIMMLLINQVVKSGDFSGSESIQHIVDATLFLESDNETPLKFLRATKNRFGSTTEIGVFQHSEKGLEEVSDPSDIFIEKDEKNVSGSACSFISEGVRQIPVEIQSLVTKSNLSNPRKQFNGVNYNRGQIVNAILDKFCRARLWENDVFISTVSGIKVSDPQADLAIAASIISSIKNKNIPNKIAFVGELSLTGYIRGSFMIENKIREAERLGFTKIVVPSSAKIKKHNDISIVKVQTIKDLFDFIQESV